MQQCFRPFWISLLARKEERRTWTRWWMWVYFVLKILVMKIAFLGPVPSFKLEHMPIYIMQIVVLQEPQDKIFMLFQTPFKQASELRDTREQLTACFENFSCYFLPHPGFKVAERKSYIGEAKGDSVFRLWKYRTFHKLSWNSATSIQKKLCLHHWISSESPYTYDAYDGYDG